MAVNPSTLTSAADLLEVKKAEANVQRLGSEFELITPNEQVRLRCKRSTLNVIRIRRSARCLQTSLTVADEITVRTNLNAGVQASAAA